MAKAHHTIRIIAGTHRSRRLPVLDFDGLRPSGDRVRETLFNWLQMHMADKQVLDLCAGAGGLGFEAASRGAKEVVMIESSHEIAQALKQTQVEYDFSQVKVLKQSAQSFLVECAKLYDIIFIDPPFAADMLQELTELALNKVNIGGFIYREAAISQEFINLPNNWELYRQKRMGQVKIEVWQKITKN